jgi:serine/threonine-protein kinase
MAFRPDEWARVREVFEAARLLSAERRTAYLASACGGDHVLRQKVDSLLAANDSARSFLETPAVLPSDDSSVGRPLEGRRVGPYQLSERIGVGGMGEV